MAYTRFGEQTGTKPVTLKIEEPLLQWITQHNLVTNKVINTALAEFVRALQTGEVRATWRMSRNCRAPRWGGIKLIRQSARIRRDLLDYLQLNTYNVNGTVNEAVRRLWQSREAMMDGTILHDVILSSLRAGTSSGHHDFSQNVCTKVADNSEPGAELVAHERDHSGISTYKMTARYLQDPCRHFRVRGTWTPDCCGHCVYYAEPDADTPLSHCTYQTD